MKKIILIIIFGIICIVGGLVIIELSNQFTLQNAQTKLNECYTLLLDANNFLEFRWDGNYEEHQIKLDIHNKCMDEYYQEFPQFLPKP